MNENTNDCYIDTSIIYLNPKIQPTSKNHNFQKIEIIRQIVTPEKLEEFNRFKELLEFTKSKYLKRAENCCKFTEFIYDFHYKAIDQLLILRRKIMKRRNGKGLKIKQSEYLYFRDCILAKYLVPIRKMLLKLAQDINLLKVEFYRLIKCINYVLPETEDVLSRLIRIYHMLLVNKETRIHAQRQINSLKVSLNHLTSRQDAIDSYIEKVIDENIALNINSSQLQYTCSRNLRFP
ncbi:hypothetical protein WICMUC_001444 [Wickerhamomyces mucosus]|uniref:Uncharacterized protein n=1 Tax=Wickerhamomyces mucosus TaxID=1378264 RepID=A0A9P8PUK2_9ASCO|nr:hypothetical protein WICMUC_001444 [Wickerhamomyces mucosus]